jgi:hypothetical protein
MRFWKKSISGLTEQREKHGVVRDSFSVDIILGREGGEKNIPQAEGGFWTDEWREEHRLASSSFW